MPYLPRLSSWAIAISLGLLHTLAPAGVHAQCGDTVVSGMETCDDGNMMSGDGCDASCDLEPGYACFTSTTPYLDVNMSGMFDAGDTDLTGVSTTLRNRTVFFDGPGPLAIFMDSIDDGLDLTVNGVLVADTSTVHAAPGNPAFLEGDLVQSWLPNTNGLPRLVVVVSATGLRFYGTPGLNDTVVIEPHPGPGHGGADALHAGGRAEQRALPDRQRRGRTHQREPLARERGPDLPSVVRQRDAGLR